MKKKEKRFLAVMLALSMLLSGCARAEERENPGAKDRLFHAVVSQNAKNDWNAKF